MGSPVHRAGLASSRSSKKKQKSSSYLLATFTGLLSSSCCIIQLILNVFSVSCAGFSILNSYRPFFLCLSIGVITASAREYGLFTRRTLTTLVIVGMLSASPEVVKLYNEGAVVESFKWQSGRTGDLAVVFELDMTGLSCQACANRVKLQIEKQQGVVRCDIFLEEMRAVVRSRPGTFKDEAQLEAQVVAAGSKYRGKVVKRYTLPVHGGVSEEQDKFEL